MRRNKVRESLLGQMVDLIEVSGRMVSRRVEVCTRIKRELKELISGLMVRRLDGLIDNSNCVDLKFIYNMS